MPAEDTRARILRVSASHFAHQGFDGASLRKIAEEVGIKAASIFHHFPGGKSELSNALVEDIGESIRVQVVERYGVDAGLSAVDSIVQMAGAFWDYFESHPDYATLILQFSSGMGRDVARILEDAAVGIVAVSREYIANAQAQGELGDFEIAHFMVWSASHTMTVHGAPRLAAFVIPEDPERTLRASYLTMVRNYIEPKEPTSTATRRR